MNRCKAGLVETTYINSYKEVFMHDENQYEPEPAWIRKSWFDDYVHNFGRGQDFGIANSIKRLEK
jgi:hypothetical protein